MRVGILGLGLMGGLSEIRKPQVKSYEVQISGFAKDTDQEEENRDIQGL